MLGKRTHKSKLLSDPRFRSILATVMATGLGWYLCEKFHTHPIAALVISLITWIILML